VGIWWEFGEILVEFWWNFGGNLVGIWHSERSDSERSQLWRSRKFGIVSAASYGAAGILVKNLNDNYL
jgi:hypothetical protein